MKRKVLAVLTAAGVLGVTGAAFADLNINVNIDETKFRPIAQANTQRPEPPQKINGQRPPEPPAMNSRDMKGRPPEPPKNGKRPPMSGDRQPPPKPRSGDRMPPDFNNGQRPEMPKGQN